MAPRGPAEQWQPVCRFDELVVDRGVTALVHGQAMAIFRTAGDRVYALGDHDPFARTSRLARGIVGTRGGVPFVAPVVHQHAFDLRTGRCLDDPQVAVAAYDVTVVEGMVLVGHRTTGGVSATQSLTSSRRPAPRDLRRP